MKKTPSCDLYLNGSEIKIGDVITDGSSGREDVRLQNRAKVLYVDKFTLVWFPLNEFTTHSITHGGKPIYKSNTYCLTCEAKKVELSELTPEELELYNSTDSILKTDLFLEKK